MLQLRQRGIMRRQPRMPLVIADQHLRARVLQPVFQLRARPPGVERDADRADRGRGEEGDRPFGQVAHRQRDAVPLPHPQPGQLVGERHRRAMAGGVGDALVLIDRQQPLAMTDRRLQQEAQRGWRVLPHPRRDAADGDGVHLELCARRGQLGAGVGDRHGGPGGGKRDDALSKGGGSAGHGGQSSQAFGRTGFPCCRPVSVDSRPAQGDRAGVI